MNQIIGIAGPAGSGKTESARMFQKLYGGTILSFAKPMKTCLQNLLDLDHDQLYTLEGKEAVDPRYGVSPRHIMQQFGTEFVRSTIPDLWVVLMRKRISNCIGDGHIFIDDVRFDDEASCILELGGSLVHMVGRESGTKRRGHQSENQLEFSSNDYVLVNDSGLPELYSQIKNFPVIRKT